MYAYLSRVCGKDLDSFVLLERKSDRQVLQIALAIFNMTWAGFVIMLANFKPTSVRMIVHYKSQPLLRIFALQLGAASCKANNCSRMPWPVQPQPGHVTRAHLLFNPLRSAFLIYHHGGEQGVQRFE